MVQYRSLCRKFVLEHPVRICKWWRYCDVIIRRLIWQRCRLNLPMQSSACIVWFLWAKGHSANAIHSEMHPVYDDKWPNEESAGSTEICLLRCGSVMGRLFTQQPTSFFCIRYSQTCWNMGHVFKYTWRVCWKVNPRCQKSLHLKF